MAAISEVTDNSFQAEVLEADTPVLVDFWAPWCGPCRMVAPIVDELSDEYDGKVKFVKLNTDDNALVQPESRAAFRTLLDHGWLDALRKVHPKEQLFTFWDYRRNRWQRDAGLRLDHMLLSRKLSRKLVGAGIDREVRGMEGASDHAPVSITLRD